VLIGLQGDGSARGGIYKKEASRAGGERAHHRRLNSAGYSPKGDNPVPDRSQGREGEGSRPSSVVTMPISAAPAAGISTPLRCHQATTQARQTSSERRTPA
jgi:hypothetical protein